ncbi:hypothetical protein B0H14DRAFT_2683496 [Mycena olivaceomarginata]|nr:hypothetical protein B0H14DRAFT_2683496 [Mycena olivaceomarginata]
MLSVPTPSLSSTPSTTTRASADVGAVRARNPPPSAPSGTPSLAPVPSPPSPWLAHHVCIDVLCTLPHLDPIDTHLLVVHFTLARLRPHHPHPSLPHLQHVPHLHLDSIDTLALDDSACDEPLPHRPICGVDLGMLWAWIVCICRAPWRGGKSD